jgi:hypothetical protein
MKLPLALLTTTTLLLVAGCSEPPATPKKDVTPLPPVTGRNALYKMFNAARSWSLDVEVLDLRSIDMKEVKVERGLSAAWQATFVSARLNRQRPYTYSIIESEGNLHKGVFAGLEDSWTGPHGASTPFVIAAVKTDSDEVYRTALKKGAEYDRKNPNKPIAFVLEKTDRFPNPAWRVVWGESVGTSNFSIFIDASTGLYLQTIH